MGQPRIGYSNGFADDEVSWLDMFGCHGRADYE